MRRRLVIGLLAGIVLLPVALVGMLVYTETGVRLIAGQLPRLERVGLRVEGVSGTLSGPLRIERFELDLPRVHIVAHDIVADPQMRGMLLQTVRIASLSARDLSVTIRPPDAEQPPSQRPLRFLPEFMRVYVRAAEFTHVRYVHVDGRMLEAEHLSGRARIGPRQIRVRDFSVVGQGFEAGGNLRLHAERPLGIELDTRGVLRLPSGSELALGAELQGDLDELAIRGAMERPSHASIAALLTRADGQWRLEGRVASPAFSLTPWLSKPPFSLRNVDLEVTATPAEIAIAGRAGISGLIPLLDEHDLGIAARGHFAGRALHIAAADARITDRAARLQASGTVEFAGDHPAFDIVARWNDLSWPLGGAADVAGPIVSPRGRLALRGAHPYEFDVVAAVQAGQLPAVDGRARGLISRERLALDDFDVAVLGGRVAGTGTLELAAPTYWQAALTLHDLDPGLWRSEFPGRVSLEVSGHGTGLDRNAHFAATVRDLRGTLRGQRLAGAGTIVRSAQGWQAHDARLSFGDARLELDGRWGEALDLRWSLHAGSLAHLLPGLAGTLTSSGTALGPRHAPRVTGELEAEQLVFRQWQAGRLAVSAQLDLGGDSVSRFAITARQAGYDGALLDALRIDGEGTAGAHIVAVQADAVRATPAAPLRRAQLRAAGRFAGGLWHAQLTGNVADGGEPWLEMTESARLAAGRERVTVENLCFALAAGHVCAQGDWRRGGSWQASLSGSDLQLARILPSSEGGAEYAGDIEGRVALLGQAGDTWQGDALLKINDAAVIYRPPGMEPETLHLGSGEIEAAADRERIEAALSLQAFTDTFVFARAQLLRNGGGLLELPLSGEFRARAADAGILPILFPEVDHAAGVLTANARLGGTLAAPQVDGRIQLNKGELDSYRINLALRDLSVTADIADNRLTFSAAGHAGEGRLQADGHLAWHDGASHGEISLRGANLLVADLPEYRVVASPDLRFEIAGTRIDVHGEVVIPSARIQPVDLTGAVRISEDARYVGEHPAEIAGRFVVRSDVRVDLGDDVRLETLGLQGRLTGGVRTTLRSGEVAIGRGELSVVEGRYEAYGQKLDITRGRLLFEASPLDDPGLDIETRRQIENIQVGLNVRGTLRSPRLSFFSEPSMPQTQIVSYLLVGKPLEDMQSRDAAAVGSARSALAMQGGGLIASQLGRRLGLEEIGVESFVDSTGESNTALVLGKFLSPRLFVSYGISLTESINTLKVRYTLSDRWVLRSEAGEHQSVDAEYTIER